MIVTDHVFKFIPILNFFKFGAYFLLCCFLNVDAKKNVPNLYVKKRVSRKLEFPDVDGTDVKASYTSRPKSKAPNSTKKGTHYLNEI